MLSNLIAFIARLFGRDHSVDTITSGLAKTVVKLENLASKKLAEEAAHLDEIARRNAAALAASDEAARAAKVKANISSLIG